MSETQEAIFQDVHIEAPKLLGEGVEASIYELDSDRVLRIYRSDHQPDVKTLKCLRDFYGSLNTSVATFQLPAILDIREAEGRCYTIDCRLYGTPLDEVLKVKKDQERSQLLQRFIEAGEQVQQLASYDFFGEVLAPEPIRDKTWPGFLWKKLSAAYATGKDDISRDIESPDRIMEFVRGELDLVADVTEAKLVHGDYYYPNVLISNDDQVSAVMDFNNDVLAGDPRMDLGSAALVFLDGADFVEPGDKGVILDYLTDRYGQNMPRIIHLYKLYYAIYFASFTKETDNSSYQWAIKSLKEHLAGKSTV